jgi:hypothetical protein
VKVSAGQVIRFQDIFMQGLAVCILSVGLLATRYFASAQHGNATQRTPAILRGVSKRGNQVFRCQESELLAVSNQPTSPF